jgi:hypothetical protein
MKTKTTAVTREAIIDAILSPDFMRAFMKRVIAFADDGFLMFRVRNASGRKVVTGKEILKCWEERYL